LVSLDANSPAVVTPRPAELNIEAPVTRTFPPETLEQIRGAYERGTLPARTVGSLFGLANGEIYALVKAHGWAARSEMTPRERAAAARAAEGARQVELYGDLAGVDDVRLLRSRGFVVVREGDRFRVGAAVCSLAEVRAKASRERRLNHLPEHRAAAAR